MIDKLQQAIQQLQFYLEAADSNGHGTHSPFVYQFITEVLNDERHFYAYNQIEFILDDLKKDKRKINYNGLDTSIARIAKSLLHPKYNQLLFRMVEFYKPTYILEVGGSLGITTAYLATPNQNNQVYNIETNELMAMLAKQTLKDLHLNNAAVIIPNPTYSLSQIKKDGRTFGMILFNISSEDRLDTFTSLTTLINEETIVIISGINKNLKNKLVWENLKEQMTITMSIELFEMGLLFFRKEALKKQCFKVRF